MIVSHSRRRFRSYEFSGWRSNQDEKTTSLRSKRMETAAGWDGFSVTMYELWKAGHGSQKAC